MDPLGGAFFDARLLGELMGSARSHIATHVLHTDESPSSQT